MNYARLRVFDAVVRHGTFAAAAEALSFTPSAISQQVARLEAEAGVPLLERSGRGVRPTPAGRLLHEHAERIIGEVAAARADLEALADLRKGFVRLGCFATAIQGFAAEVVRRYRARYVGIDVRLVDDEPYANIERLQEGELDLAIVFGFPDSPLAMDYCNDRLAAPTDELELAPLFEEPFVAVLADGHRLADMSQLTVDDLGDEIVVGAPNHPGFSQFVAQAERHDVVLRFSGHWTYNYESVRALVAAGEGIGLMPQMATGVPFPGTVVRAFAAGGPVRNVSVVHRNRSSLSPAAAAMVALLHESARVWGGPSAVPLLTSAPPAAGRRATR